MPIETGNVFDSDGNVITPDDGGDSDSGNSSSSGGGGSSSDNGDDGADVVLTDVEGEDGYRLTEEQLEERKEEDDTDGLAPAQAGSGSTSEKSREKSAIQEGKVTESNVQTIDKLTENETKQAVETQKARNLLNESGGITEKQFQKIKKGEQSLKKTLEKNTLEKKGQPLEKSFNNRSEAKRNDLIRDQGFSVLPNLPDQLPKDKKKVEQLQEFRKDNPLVRATTSNTSVLLENRKRNLEAEENLKRAEKNLEKTENFNSVSIGGKKFTDKGTALKEIDRQQKEVKENIKSGNESFEEIEQRIQEEPVTEGAGPSPGDFVNNLQQGEPVNAVKEGVGDFFDPTSQVDENLDASEEAVIAGLDVMQKGQDFGDAVGDLIPRPEEGKDTAINTAREITEENGIGSEEDREKVFNQFDRFIPEPPTQTSSLERGIATISTATEQAQEADKDGEFDREDQAETFIELARQQVESGTKEQLDARENIISGTATGGTQLAGLIVGGGGAVTSSIEADIKTGLGQKNTGPGSAEGIISGFKKVGSQIAEDPGEFVAEEIGEEVGEKLVFGTLTSGAALVASSVPTPEVTPSIPTPEVTPNPETSFISGSNELIGKTSSSPRIRQEDVPETEDLPDLGEQALGRERENVLEEPKNQLLGQNFEDNRVGQPEPGRGGVPETSEEFRLTREETKVLERRRDRTGEDNTRVEVRNIDEDLRTGEPVFVRETDSGSLEQDVTEAEGTEGILGASRKGQTSGIPLIPENTEPDTTPDTGFEQDFEGEIRIENENELSTFNSRRQNQQPETPQDLEPGKSIDSSLREGLGLGLSLDPSTSLQQGQQPAQAQNQELENVQDIDLEEEIVPELTQKTTQTPGGPEPTPTLTFQPKISPEPKIEITPETTTPTITNTPEKFDFDEDSNTNQNLDTDQESLQLSQQTEFRTSLAGELFDVSEEEGFSEEDFEQTGFSTGFNLRTE